MVKEHIILGLLPNTNMIRLTSILRAYKLEGRSRGDIRYSFRSGSLSGGLGVVSGVRTPDTIFGLRDKLISGTRTSTSFEPGIPRCHKWCRRWERRDIGPAAIHGNAKLLAVDSGSGDES